MTFSALDSRFMALAISLAKKGWYTTRSNPRVGCVLVKNQQVIGQGWHQKAGLAHAEINALKDAQQRGHCVEGATAYVTLEPCAHHGKTPPCAQALIDAKVAKVICAMQDPNPLVAGKGLQMLQSAGIETAFGLQQAQAELLNLGFIKRMQTGLPRVVAKIAMSLDGRTAMANGQSQWITGSAARAEVQKLRAESGAILTGSGTVIIDNPSMNVRELDFLKDPHFEQPLRVVVDSQHLTDIDAKIYAQEGMSWLVAAQYSSKEYPATVEQKIFAQNLSANPRKIDLEALLRELASEGVNDVLLEAGAGLNGAMLEQGLVDEMVVFVAAKLMGSDARAMAHLPFTNMSQNIDLQLIDIRQIGDDLKLHYRIERV